MLPRVLFPWQQVTHVGLLLQGQVASGGLSFDPCCLEDFDMMQVLGTGSFGRVTLAKHRESETVCAVKALSKAHMLKNQQVSSQKGKQTQRSSALVVCITRRQWAVWSSPAAAKCTWLAWWVTATASILLYGFILPVCTSGHMLIGLQFNAGSYP